MSPATTGPTEVSSLSTISAASVVITVVSVAETGAAASLVAVAVLDSVPVVEESTSTVIVNTTEPPGAILVGPHVTVPANSEHPGALTNVVPAGIVSVTITPVAVDGPEFETVIV